jgi:hypothetical protein
LKDLIEYELKRLKKGSAVAYWKKIRFSIWIGKNNVSLLIKKEKMEFYKQLICEEA